MEMYSIDVSFGGFIGATLTYEVEAESYEQAKEIALEMACDDLYVEE